MSRGPLELAELVADALRKLPDVEAVRVFQTTASSASIEAKVGGRKLALGIRLDPPESRR